MENLNLLLEKALEIARMDLNHIYGEVVSGKLAAPSARDLVSYVKLLADAQEQADKAGNDLSKLTKEELLALLQKFTTESKS